MIKYIFFNQVPYNILLGIDGKKITSEISSEVNCAFCSVVKIIKRFKEEGLVYYTQRDGRSKSINLTEKGKLVQNEIKELINLLGGEIE